LKRLAATIRATADTALAPETMTSQLMAVLLPPSGNPEGAMRFGTERFLRLSLS
jgi:hypothetical protein